MAEIINLRRIKKRLARGKAATEAQAARSIHGRSKAERLAQGQDRAMRERQLDNARLTDPAGDGEAGE